jgi:predicted metal-dependent hydrolase
MMRKYKLIVDKLGEVEINEKKIKKCYLRVYQSGKISASVPENYGISRAQKFVISNTNWIRERLKIVKESQNQSVFYLGNEVSIEDYDVKSINQFFESKKKEAYSIFRSIMQFYLEKYPEFAPLPILKVRSMVSWGLYNKTKNLITLNIKLIQADIESIKMVVFHELCHIIEQNHSERFYMLVKREFTAYKAIKQRMKMYNTRF